jgi:hypothetical protein
MLFPSRRCEISKNCRVPSPPGRRWMEKTRLRLLVVDF